MCYFLIFDTPQFHKVLCTKEGGSTYFCGQLALLAWIKILILPRQEYWSGVAIPSPWDLPDPGIKLRSSALQADFSPSEPPGRPNSIYYFLIAAITSSYKLSALKQHKFTTLHFWKTEVQKESHWAKIKVLAGAVFLFGGFRR